MAKPKGSPKTGGRQRGTPNRATASVKEAARQHTADAMKVLTEVMKDTTQPAAARVAAVKEIFDRAYGKATQHIAGDADAPAIKTEQSVDISGLPLEVQRMIAQLPL